jgi:hypothetical protein
MNHITDNHDALLDYLYEEGDPAERLTIAKHLQECAPCAVAVLEFQNVRGMLSDWKPPASQLGFRMVQDASPSAPVTSPSATVTSPSVRHDHRTRGGWSWGWGPTTAWGPATTRGLLQAAAAILLFVSGMAVSQVHVEYQDGALRLSWRRVVETPRNVRSTSITLHPENPSPGTNDGSGSIDSYDNERELLLQRVRAMIDQSEQRQQRELALRLSQVSREVDTQHKADLLQIQQDFGQQQDATMEYLVKTSGGVK